MSATITPRRTPAIRWTGAAAIASAVLLGPAALGGAGGPGSLCATAEVITTDADEEVTIRDQHVVVLVNDVRQRLVVLDQSLPNIVVNTADGDDVIDVRTVQRPVVLCTGDGDDSLLHTGDDLAVYAEGDLDARLFGVSPQPSGVVVEGDAHITSGQPVDLVVDGDAVITTGRWDDRIEVRGEAEISSGDGNDTIRLGSGNDVVDAGPGNDWIISGSGRDTVDGGPGYDNCDRNTSDQALPQPDFGPRDTYLNCELVDADVTVGQQLPPGFRPTFPR